MKAILKLAETEKRDLTAEENTQFDALNTKAEQRKADIDSYETAKRLDTELAAKGGQRQQHPGREDVNTPEAQAEEKDAEYRAQFEKFLRGGNPIELRALTVSGQGVVGTREFSTDLVKAMKSFAGVLDAGTMAHSLSDSAMPTKLPLLVVALSIRPLHVGHTGPLRPMLINPIRVLLFGHHRPDANRGWLR